MDSRAPAIGLGSSAFQAKQGKFPWKLPAWGFFIWYTNWAHPGKLTGPTPQDVTQQTSASWSTDHMFQGHPCTAKPFVGARSWIKGSVQVHGPLVSRGGSNQPTSTFTPGTLLPLGTTRAPPTDPVHNAQTAATVPG